ncbi:MAG TPA: ribonuclease P protein component [Rubrivivax sp.]|nr:ribonuclease P protein component [Rubrivivax sp.]
MIGRLLRKSDFERLLAVPPCSRSAHFAVHYLHACPGAATGPGANELCTSDAPDSAPSVDNLWLGTVVPKRHAPRAVTRNVLRRQVRAAMQRQQPRLRPGMWLVRLRQPFARSSFVSADSIALRRAAASELDRLLQRAGT